MKKFISVLISLAVAVSAVSAGVNALTPSYEVSESYRQGDYYKQLTEVELTGNYIDDIINVAKSQKNYHEGSTPDDLSGFGTGYYDYTEYNYWYGYTVGWCAIFISWCARQAGIPESIISNNSWADGQGGNFGEKEVYAFADHEPQKGDIVYIDNDSDPDADHVGLVYDVDDTFIYTLEGNTSHIVYDIKYYKDTGIQHYYNTTKIVYYGVPDYGVADEESPAPQEPEIIYEAGDINADGRITAVDALTALQSAVGLLVLTPEEFKRADMNSDGVITSFDALEILTAATK